MSGVFRYQSRGSFVAASGGRGAGRTTGTMWVWGEVRLVIGGLPGAVATDG